MPIELRILTGARGGHRERFEKPIVALGRHLQCDLRFDPNTDLDVSARHAEIIAEGNSYLLRDCGSTNGTFLDGRRITGDEPLAEGDVIWLGAEGPHVEVHVIAPSVSAVRGDAVGETLVRPSSARASTGERVKLAVREETAGMRRFFALVAVLLAVFVGGAAYWLGHRDSHSQTAELMQLLAQSDSTAATIQARLAAAGDTTFASALRRQHAELAERVRSVTPSATQAEVDSLRSELRRRQVMQQGIALLDLSSISVKNDSAIAFLVTELDGKPYGGTAFGVTPSGLLVTNRHNVRSPLTGRGPTRLAVKYANTDVFLHARVAQLSPDSTVDLALIQVDEPGSYPVVSGVARSLDSVRAGAPVVAIGFPHALDLPMDGNVVKTSLTAGTISKLLPDLLQVDAYASHGSSGTPIFDAHGWVIGIVYGGDAQSGGRLTYAVPASKLAPMLAGGASWTLRP
jgi:S1-C subfamily serine protease